jgi:hypothetical protein
MGRDTFGAVRVMHLEVGAAAEGDLQDDLMAD